MSQDESQNETRRVISEVLGIENSAAWDIVSSDPEHHLYMVHHKPEANLSEYGQIRGIVVDTNAKTIVCRSYGYAPTVVSDQVLIQPGDGNIHLIDELGLEHVVDPARSNFKIGFEGTLINVFKHDGKVYRATRKRLDPARSRWGNSKTFMEMYWELGGPTDEVLFDPESKYSPYCHVFIIVHPDVLVVSKDNIGDGYLVYLGPKQMWSLDYNDSPYKQTQKDESLFPGVTQEDFEKDPRPNAGWIDPDVHVPQTVSNMGANTSHTHTIFSPHNLSIEEANKHLMFGFYNEFEGYDKLDRRMLPGEFIIVHKLDENGATTGMVRVESTPYSWRSGMRDNNPNILHRFYQMVNGSYLRYDSADGKARYNALYPIFEPFDEASIKDQINNDGAYVVWPQDGPYYDPEYLMDKESRMYNIWLAFLNSVPLHKQKDVAGYLDNLYKKRGDLIGWLKMIENRGHLDATEYSRRLIDIIQAARRFAQEKTERGQDRDRRGHKQSVKDMTRDNIRNLLMKEEGSSLYRLIREMERWNRDQEELRREQEELRLGQDESTKEAVTKGGDSI